MFVSPHFWIITSLLFFFSMIKLSLAVDRGLPGVDTPVTSLGMCWMSTRGRTRAEVYAETENVKACKGCERGVAIGGMDIYPAAGRVNKNQQSISLLNHTKVGTCGNSTRRRYQDKDPSEVKVKPKILCVGGYRAYEGETDFLEPSNLIHTQPRMTKMAFYAQINLIYLLFRKKLTLNSLESELRLQVFLHRLVGVISCGKFNASLT